MTLSVPLRRALAAAVAGALALAAPAAAAAEPVKAGPALPDELAVLTVGGALATPANFRADAIALRRIATNGTFRGQVAFPATSVEGVTPLTKDTFLATIPFEDHALKRSVDGRFVTFTGLQAAAGTSNADRNFTAAVRVAADGTRVETPLGNDGFVSSGVGAAAAVTVDGSRWWLASNGSAGTIAPGEANPTDLGTIGNKLRSADIVDGSFQGTLKFGGVSRIDGPLPTEGRPPVRQLIALYGAVDSAFVDTDGVDGTDTAYVTRGSEGLYKYVRTGNLWERAGNRLEGNFHYLAARVVDGAVELYATTSSGSCLQKVVDTAQIGGDFQASGAEPLSCVPADRRYAGVAFAPGSGFTGDPTPYPAAPPALYPSVTEVRAVAKSSFTVGLTGPNTPGSELTLTASSASATVLPQDRITITGSGANRTVTVDPVADANTTLTLTVTAGSQQATARINVRAGSGKVDPTSHSYGVGVDVSAAVDLGGRYFVGMSDELNNPVLLEKGVAAGLTDFPRGFPVTEADYEGGTRFGDTIVWSGSHGNNRDGQARQERRMLSFQRVTGTGQNVKLEWTHNYTRLRDQWVAWDAANGHGLGANYLKFNTATVPGLIPNAPHGFNVEGLTMAPGSQSIAWFGMRAPTITGADGIERAVILPVNNIDELTSNAVNAELGQPILLDLGGRSIRDISKNASDQYLISAGPGDTDDSLKNWALYAWNGDPAWQPHVVAELPNEPSRVGAWEAVVEVPEQLVPGAKALLAADSGDAGLSSAYAQYVTLGTPMAAPAAVTGVQATAGPGTIDVNWNAAEGASRYYVTVRTPAGTNAPGTPRFVTETSTKFVGVPAGTEYTVDVRAENTATRSASATKVNVAPVQGPRTPTTTTLQVEGSPLFGETVKLTATVSEPTATGTIRFDYDNGNIIPDDVLQGTGVYPVVDGKVTINTTSRIQPGLRNLRAVFTTTNTEVALSSSSAIQPMTFMWKPRAPKLEVVSIAGDRVVGGRLAIKAKLSGYTATELDDPRPVTVSFGTRVNGAAARTAIAGEVTPETPNAGGGNIDVNADGEATIHTTALAAGKHRLAVQMQYGRTNDLAAYAAEIPLEIAPAGSSPAEPRAITVPKVAVSVTGSRIMNQPHTLTARVSDRSLAGTVQFYYYGGTALGTPVPVVNGVATRTGTIPSDLQQVFARFEPTDNRDTTASAVSLGVGIFQNFNVEPVLGDPTPTTTTLTLEGERVVGQPLTARIEVKTDSTAPAAERDINGYVELLAGGAEIAMIPVLRGKATETVTLPVGVHTLQARYVSSDERRSVSSASAEQTVAVAVTTDAESPVGGDVSATLALALGAPVTFGAFTPGVAREYTASTTATVISTAGDATLTVADSGANPGHLVNGAFALAQPLQGLGVVKTWNAPTSNEAVPVEFKQAIGATDPLRTGTYSKTLTFTLSTTTP